MIDDFPSRKEILNKPTPSGYKKTLIEQVKQIDIDKVDFENSDFKPRNKIVEKQKIYRWSRLFTNSEITDVKVNDKIIISHLPTGEQLQSFFICYAKKNVKKDADDNIITYDGEEDKKILCLMVDTEHLESSKVSFIRSLFPNTKWYEYNILKRSELVFTNKRTGQQLEYFDIEF